MTTPERKPAFLKNIKRTRVARFGHKRVKMLQPRCDECQTAEAPRDWYLACDHDPFVSVREMRREVPIYTEPDENGEVMIDRVEEKISFIPWPNLVQVSVWNTINSGEGIERAKARGYIFPEDLRSPAFPSGVAPMCEFQGCFWQHDLKGFRDGVFCREDEARVIAQFFTNRDKSGSMRYGAVEVMHPALMAEGRAKVNI